MRRLAIVVVAALSHSAHADDISFPETLASVDRAPQTRAGEAAVASALAGVDAANAWPATSFSAATNRLTARAMMGVRLPLPFLGTLHAARFEAEAHARVVQAESAGSRRDVQRRAALAWLALARAEADVAALAIAVQQATDLEKIAQGRLEAGAGAEVDVTTARAARARAQVEAAAGTRAHEAASADLAAIIGGDPLRLLHAAGPLPTGTATLDALRPGLAMHPERATAARRVAEDEASAAHIAVEKRPTLAADGLVSISDPTTPGTDILIGLTFDLPVFAHIGDRLRSAEAHTRSDRLQLAATDTKLSGELVAAFRRWESSTERFEALQRDVLPAQEHSTELAAKAYREGARDLATALQAARDLTSLRAELTNARIAASVAWVELLLASGRGLDAQ